MLLLLLLLLIQIRPKTKVLPMLMMHHRQDLRPPLPLFLPLLLIHL